ncbi:long-chain fatty acid--CoA ligase [Streptomyces sp. NPDC005898]|uniref:AMP-dependent synthetase/ligase n=1 Tax=Streptomyces sp. NPDC005898 TaxID=3157082 RepID=UPI003406D5B7
MRQTRKEPVAAAELPQTLALLTEWAADRHGEGPALRFRRGGAWADLSYVELRERVRRTGRALIALGVRPDDRVAILAETRPEWTYAHFGALATGAVVVPVYPTAGGEETAWVVRDSGAGTVLCENPAQAAKIDRLRAEGRLPGVRHVVLLTEDPEPAPAPAPGKAPEAPEATAPEGAAEVTAPEGAAEVTAPEGAAEVTVPEGAAEGTVPEGAAEGTGTEVAAEATGAEAAFEAAGTGGAAEATAPEGAPEATAPEGAAEATTPEGAAEATGTEAAAEATGTEAAAEATRTEVAAEAVDSQGGTGAEAAAEAAGPRAGTGPVPVRPTPSAPARLRDLPLASLDVFLSRAAGRAAGDLATVIYTSGTTGLPKGCLLTHGNLLAVQRATVPLVDGGPGDSTYLYLPLAHLLAQLIEFTTLAQGGTLTFFGGRVEDVVAELQEARPTHLPSVPRLFEKVRSFVLSLAQAREGGRERFEEAVRIGVMAADGTLPPELRDAYEAADKELYGLVRQALGGRLRWALTGGAPIAPDTVDFLRACGIAVYEGYGMTESAGVLTLNHPGAVRYGTVGRPVDGVELRIAPDGEILARGAMVFAGYHNDPRATRATLDDEGWLRTGDLGALDEDGYLTITGRKKDLIITSGGKNLTPSLSELALQTSPFVSRAVMVGDRRPHPVALITLDAEEVTGWAAREGRELATPLSRDPRVRALVQEAVDAANATVSRPARIRDFAVLDEDFTVESGLLTPSLKVRRQAVTERYTDVLEELYGSGEPGEA